jgi:putative restriction endonuclease
MEVLMARTFSAIDNTTPVGKKSSVRALQCWQVLVSKASCGRIITYGELAKLIRIHHRPIYLFLGHILHYCRENKLPLLNSIVVNKKTRIPGEGAGLKEDRVPAMHKKVFSYDWFDEIPPTIEELKEAFDKGRKD